MKIKFIGNIINQLRVENDLSIEELAARSGIPASRIEIIESGEAIPSISSIIRISHALGARLGTLLDNQTDQSVVVTRAEQRVNHFQQSPDDHNEQRQFDFQSLARGMKNRSMEPMIVNIEQGKIEFNSEHQGEEFIYILSGVVEIKHAEKQYTLTTGDSIYYDSSTEHSIANLATEPAQVLAVIYTPY